MHSREGRQQKNELCENSLSGPSAAMSFPIARTDISTMTLSRGPRCHVLFAISSVQGGCHPTLGLSPHRGIDRHLLLFFLHVS